MRYLIFGGENYYPNGGAGDYLCCANSEDEAKEYVTQLQGKTITISDNDDFKENIELEWFSILDTKDMTVITPLSWSKE